jgi:hypothetical protein
MFGLAMASSLVAYIVISLCGKTVCNMDHLLHRGKYAVEGEATEDNSPVRENMVKTWWNKFVTKEFTIRDKILYLATLGWATVWFGVFIAGCIYNSFHKISDQAWLTFWHVWLVVTFWSSIAVALWLLVGGMNDLKKMFMALKKRKVDFTDDGWVSEEKEQRGACEPQTVK